MALQRSQGKARPTVARADELPAGEPAREAKQSSPVARDRGGRILTSEAAKELGRRGGKKSGEARAENNPKRWGARLGLGTLLADPLLGSEERFAPFMNDAEHWYRAKVEELASTIGGGIASAGVCSIVRTAAMERMFSAFLFEMQMTRAFAFARGSQAEGKTGAKFDIRVDLAQVASRLGDSSRQNLLAAHELCAREAMARKSAPTTATSEIQARLERVLADEADRYRAATKALEAKRQASATVDAPTDSRESVRGTKESIQDVPEQEHAPAPPAPPAAPTTSPAPTMSVASPSAPVGNVTPASPVHMSDEERLRQLCKEFLANEPRRTIEQAQLCNELQTKAEVIVLGSYRAAQDAEQRWQREGRRGRPPVPMLRVPWPASDWFRNHGDGREASYAARVYGWVLDSKENVKP